MIFTLADFLGMFRLRRVSYEEFCSELSVLDISDTSGTFAVRCGIDEFIRRVSRGDGREERLPLFKQRLYQILVTDAEAALERWFTKYASLDEPLEHYFHVPHSPIPTDGIFDGRHRSSYGRICKNLNFREFYGTKKLYSNDSEYCLGLIRAAFEDFKIRNSLACPAFFDRLCRSTGYDQFWTDFMFGANKPSVFNPTAYLSMLDGLFTGETLFAPVSGWNAYQLAFYSSGFKHYVTTDVIPTVVENGRWLQGKYERHQHESALIPEEKTSHHYLCPSERLRETDFLDRYGGRVDAVLFSPPYFDLEIYPSENQSIQTYPHYDQWLLGYWRETVRLCSDSMRRGARMGFVVSNYKNKAGEKTTISEDLARIAGEFLSPVAKHQVRWSAMGGSRQAKKTRGGNYEDLWLFEKG